MKTIIFTLAAFIALIGVASAEVIVEPHGGAAGGICFGVNCGR